MKKYASFIILFFALLGCSSQAVAQNLSNRGTDFWVGYGHHQFMESGANSQEMVLYLSAEAQAATVTVSLNGTAWSRTYNVPANSVISTGTAVPIAGTPGAGPFPAATIPKAGTYDARLYTVPCGFLPPGTACGGEGQFNNKGIHIVSNVPIVAYAHIYGSASSGATMLMPVETWGYSYVTLNSKQEYATNCFSWAYVIAQHDNTVVEITPSQTTRFPRAANTPFTVTLNRGQIYQIMAGPETGSTKPEFSGTKFKSIANAAGECYPIAVFAGSSRTRGGPVSCGSPSGGDNDNQQCFPTQSWGKRYLTTPTSNSATASTPMWNTFKIAVKDPTTVVKRNGVVLTGLTNSYYEFISNTADYIEADKPVMVAQFIHSGSACFGGGGVGDPEMMYISPIEQGIKRIGFFRNDEENITVNYLTLTIPTAGLASLLIDGSATFTHTYPHPNLPGYTVVVRRWTGAQAQATASSDSAFTAITYGLGSVESYGYNAGTLINNLNAVGSIFNTSDTSTTVTSHPFTCTNTPVKLSVLLGYQTPPTQIVWQLSTVGGGLAPNTDVTDNAPTPVGTQMVNGVVYSKYELPGTYTFTTAGTYRIPILATHPSVENCNNRESLYYDIEVRGKPSTNFAINHTGCLLDTVHFIGETVSANGFNLNQWLYTFHDATTSISKDTSKLYAAPGTYNVNLRVVTTEGCVGDTTKEVIIGSAPVSSFSIDDPAVCEGSNISFNSTAAYAGITNYYWDFGDGTIVNTPSPAAQTHAYSTFGTYTVRHSISVGPVCISDTSDQVVTVSAIPSTSFTYPAGCLPATGVVQFTSTAFAADGQPITNHLWTFGDPASGAANTSALANPTHTYPGFGNYTITYQTSTAACSKDTTVNATFNLAPAFSYPALANVCQNSATTINVATATVTNAVPGAGVYNGPGTTTAGIFDPAAAGAGTHTIWYVYTANSGCKDSISQTITVDPTPEANFTIAGAGCLPPTGTVTFTYSGTAQTGQTYAWDFGDPASGVNNTSALQNPTHNYTTGNYTITLTVTNPATGCVVTETVTQTFNVTPALNYPALAPTCENLTNVNIATATVTNGVTGTGVYSGPGTTAAGIFDPSVAGAGTHTITYTFTGTGNCVATITQTILVNAKPNASFTYPTAACLPASGIANFTYNGSMSAGQTYVWNFGDPASGANNTSTAQNPSHTYTNTGTYSVSVTVTNANGCIDDSVINNIVFSVTPALSFPALTAVCSNDASFSVANATVTNGVSGTGVYSGPGTDAAGNFDPAAAGPGTHSITYTFTSSANCVASIASTILVNAAPSATFTASTTACLPANGNVVFTYTGTAQPGQTYAWNFGDPASGANNTSAIANPSHNFAEGNYMIILTVTNPATGCIDKDTLVQTFALTPALAYPALTATCENLTNVNVATATVTNGVAGTGVYSGPGTSSAGIFNPTIAGAGTHTITYTFTSSANCVASITQTIVVNAKPNASFTYPTTACLPATGIANFTYNGSMSAGQTYLWNFGDPASGANNTSTAQNPSHTYTNTGSYSVSVTVTNANGCIDDSVINNIVFSVTPALNYPVLAAVCENLTSVNVATATVTNGVTGTGVYSGPGTSAAGIFDPSVAGPGTHIITYTFTSTGNCVSSITQNILVNARPAASFTYPTAACLPATGIANFTYNGSMSAGQTYLWNFGDPASGANNTSTAQNPSHTYTNTGSYSVSVTVTNANGCIDDSVINNIVFSVTPALNYPALAAVCENLTSVNVATATVTNSVTGTGVYSGPGTSAAGIFDPSVAGPGTHIITYTFTSTGNCVSSITQNIVVNARPAASFTYPTAACLPATGIANFTYNGSMSAGQTYLWNFGDPASGANNTSTAQNPSHTYTNTGSYSVSVTVTNANGCIDDSVINNIVFSVTPALNYPVLAAVCENLTSVNVATATVTNGVTGTGVYSGPGTSAAGIFDPSVAGPGTHIITYTFTSTGNCVSTVTRNILVNPKPVSAFTITPDICLGQQANITSNATIPTGTITTWKWFFGDGNTATYTNGSAFTYLYTAFGSYTVKLVTVSADGCESDTARQTITVGTVPVASFTMPASVCMPDGVTFSNNSTVSDGSTLTYAWNFGDPASGANNTSTATSPTHVYATAGSYTISLRATGGNGCFKDTVQVFDQFFNKPIAAFSVNPTELCQGTDNVFTDLSTAPNSSISSRLWIFGDGTTSTATNPTKRYTNPGVYQVKLVVTNAQGCVSDTFPQSITVHLQPVIDAGPSFVVAQGSVIQFAATANDNSGTTAYLWSPATGLSAPASLTPQLTAMADQTYTLTATGSGNCTATDFITVKILKPLKIPNAFSPNGDGVNDTWIIENLADYPGAIVEIYNRYGQIVMKSTGYSRPWDGTTNGKPLPLATYYYIIQLKNGFKPLNGSITIIK